MLVEGNVQKEDLENLIKPYDFKVDSDAILTDPDKNLFTYILEGPQGRYKELEKAIDKLEGYQLFSNPKISGAGNKGGFGNFGLRQLRNI